MRVISVPEFKQKIHDDEGVVNESVSVNNQVYIKAKEVDVKFFSFTSIYFQKGIVFENVGDIKAGIKFKNCSGDTLLITGCNVSTPSDEFELPLGSGLILEKSNFKKVQIIGNPDFNRGIIIRDESNIEDLEILNSSFEKASINIERSTIHNSLDIQRIQSLHGIKLNYATVKCKVRIFKAEGGSFVSLKSVFEKDIHLDHCRVNLVFNHSIFKDTVYLKENITKTITSIGDKFSQRLEYNAIPTEKINELYIQNTETGEGFIFDGNESEISKIQIPVTNLLNGTFKFSNYNIHEGIISGPNLSANIIFRNAHFKSLKITDFHNKAGFTLATCSSYGDDSVLEIKESHLGNAVFLSFDFGSFKRIVIESSVLHDIELSNPILPSPHQIQTEEIEAVNSNTKKREVYRQLRHAVSKKGGSILSTELHATELDLFRREKQHEGFFNKDRIMLWMSSSNDMGLNWSKPIWLLFLFTIPFYCLVVISHTYELVWLPDIKNIDWGGSLEIYCSYGAYFWSMFNPVRNLRFIMNEDLGNLNGWVYLFDGLHRIILAFFIFQIVSAFRKYLK